VGAVVHYEWDDAKRFSNLAKHGVDFEAVWDLDWESAIRWEDVRKNYSKIRYAALGHIGDRLFFCVYTPRGGGRRIISLRKANRGEEELYEAETIDK